METQEVLPLDMDEFQKAFSPVEEALEGINKAAQSFSEGHWVLTATRLQQAAKTLNEAAENITKLNQSV